MENWMGAQFLLVALLWIDASSWPCLSSRLRRLLIGLTLALRVAFLAWLWRAPLPLAMGLLIVVAKQARFHALSSWLSLELLVCLIGLLQGPASMLRPVATTLVSGLPLVLVTTMLRSSQVAHSRGWLSRFGQILSPLFSLVPTLACCTILASRPQASPALALLWLALLTEVRRLPFPDERTAVALLVDSLPPAQQKLLHSWLEDLWPEIQARPLLGFPQLVRDELRANLVTHLRIGYRDLSQDLEKQARERPAAIADRVKSWCHAGRRWESAILLMSLPPEVSAHLFKELGPEEVHAITLQISRLPPTTPESRAQVIQDFLEQGRWMGPTPVSLEDWVRFAPDEVALALRQRWHKEDPPALGLSRLMKPSLLVLLLLVHVGLGLALLRQSRPDPQQDLQNQLDGLLGRGRCQVLVVDRPWGTSCTAALLGPKVVAQQFDHAILAWLKTQRGEPTVQIFEQAAQESPPLWPVDLALLGLLGMSLVLRRRWRSRVAQTTCSPAVPPQARPKPQTEATIQEELQALARASGLQVRVSQRLRRLITDEYPWNEFLQEFRRDFQQTQGWRLPSLRFQERREMEPDDYGFWMGDRMLAWGSLPPDRLLAVGRKNQLRQLSGPRSQFPHPLEQAALWIEPEEEALARHLGCQLLSHWDVLSQHLAACLKQNAHQILGLQDVQDLLDSHHLNLPCQLSLAELRKVLSLLLGRGLSIAPLEEIVAYLGREVLQTRDLQLLADGLEKRLK